MTEYHDQQAQTVEPSQSTQQQAPVTAEPAQQQVQPQSAPRQPDFKAYHVQNTPDGKAIWNPVGAAWTHRDGKGMQLQLNTMPVDGRVTLREMQQERMNNYAEQRNERAQNPQQTQNPQRLPEQHHGFRQ